MSMSSPFGQFQAPNIETLKQAMQRSESYRASVAVALGEVLTEAAPQPEQDPDTPKPSEASARAWDSTLSKINSRRGAA